LNGGEEEEKIAEDAEGDAENAEEEID